MRSILVAGAGGLVAGLLALAAGRRVPALVVGAVLVFATQFGWPHPAGPSFWPSEGTDVDAVRAVLAVAVAGALALRLALRARNLLVGAIAVAATAALAFLAADRVGVRYDALRPEFARWHTELSVIETPSLYRVLQERPERPVEPGTFVPTTITSLDGGPRPALVMLPPSKVRVDVPFEWSDAGARLSFAVAIAEDGWKELGPDRAIVFRASANGEVVFERILSRGGPDGLGYDGGEDVREWISGEIDLTGVEQVVLETSTTDGSLVPEALTCGFANLLVEIPTTGRRSLSSRLAPSLVFVVIDTMRADAYEPSPDGRTPNMAAVAARGTTFGKAYSASSWTWPSTASLLTSLTPPEHGVDAPEHNFLAERWETLAERLQREGFTTGAWSMNPLVSAAKNFDQGFETFEQTSWERASTVTDDVCRWIRDNSRFRSFLFLQFTDPHGPYDPPEDVRKKFGIVDPPDFDDVTLEALRRKGADRAPAERRKWVDWVAHAHVLYDAEVFDVDRAVGRITETLEEIGASSRTVFVLTSDHGEEFLDHGRLGHGTQLFDSTTHVPLLAAGPGVPRGEIVGDLVQNRFLAATTLDLLGVDRATTHTITGPNLFHDRGGEAERALLATAIGDWRGAGPRDMYGIREGRMLYLYGVEVGGDRRSEALFDVERDPRARKNLVTTETEIAKRYRDRIEEWRKLAAEVRPRDFGGDTSTLDMLKEFGYVPSDGDEVEDDDER
ncbi:MAG: sulfatase [Planctomycetota bacterium]